MDSDSWLKLFSINSVSPPPGPYPAPPSSVILLFFLSTSFLTDSYCGLPFSSKTAFPFSSKICFAPKKYSASVFLSFLNRFIILLPVWPNANLTLSHNVRSSLFFPNAFAAEPLSIVALKFLNQSLLVILSAVVGDSLSKYASNDILVPFFSLYSFQSDFICSWFSVNSLSSSLEETSLYINPANHLNRFMSNTSAIISFIRYITPIQLRLVTVFNTADIALIFQSTWSVLTPNKFAVSPLVNPVPAFHIANPASTTPSVTIPATFSPKNEAIFDPNLDNTLDDAPFNLDSILPAICAPLAPNLVLPSLEPTISTILIIASLPLVNNLVKSLLFFLATSSATSITLYLPSLITFPVSSKISLVPEFIIDNPVSVVLVTVLPNPNLDFILLIRFPPFSITFEPTFLTPDIIFWPFSLFAIFLDIFTPCWPNKLYLAAILSPFNT